MKKRLLPLVLMIPLFLHFTLKAQWTSMGSGISVSQRTLGGIAPLNKNVIWGFTWHASQFVPTREFTRTTDGGQNWHAGVLNGVDPDQFVIYLFPLDSQTAWLATADEKNPIKGKIYKTTDGGASWIHQATGFTGFNETPAGVYFWNENEGVAYGATGETTYNEQIAVYTTADGGENWTKIVAPNMPVQLPGEGMSLYNLAGFFCVVGDTFWFGTTKKRVFRSADRGKTWQVYDTPLTSSNYISSIGFRDGQIGLALGYNPLGIARSTDGGATWAKLPLSVPSNFRGMQIEYVPGTRSTWYLMTSPTKYMVSYNDGDTWETFDSNIEPWSLEFLDAKTGFAGSYITSPTQGGAYRWTGAPLGNRWFVNDDAAGANNGSSWADAFTDLQSALAAATESDQIWVAKGLYKPAALNGSPDATFLIDKNIRLYGGFAGTETRLDQRGNPADHPAVLSGDLNGDDVDSSFSQNRTDNVLHVVQISAAVTEAATFDGFTVRGGQADGNGAADERRGGGLICHGKPLIRQCVFEQNYALGNGGGIAMNSTSNGFALDGCTFRHNSGNAGGGLVISSTQFTVENCQFAGNSAHSGTLEANGGGIFLTNPNPGTIRNCHFSENTAVDSGAGLYAWTTASSTAASLLVSDCTFENNTTPNYGAALCLAPWGDNANFAVERCYFQANQANDGGALLLYVNSNANNASVLLDSSTFSQNHAENNGGAIFMQADGKNMNLDFNRCQFTENTAVWECGAADFWSTNGATGALRVDSCSFEKNTAFWAGALEMGCGHGNLVTQVNYFLTNSTIQNNQAAEQAGGILLWSDQKAKTNFLVENCLIRNNTSAGKGGGIVFAPTSTDYHVTINRTRIVGNQSTSSGGAAMIDFDIFQNVPFPANASVLFENCLIAGNTGTGATITADSLPNLSFLHSTVANNAGGGIQLSDQSGLTLQNTILYNPGFAEYTAATPDVTVISRGGNLIGDGSLAGHALSYDLQNVDPLFAGPGDYHLAGNSPAIDKGVDLNNLPALDLDGNDRVNRCVDIGAYESAAVVSTACVTGSSEVPALGWLRVSPNPTVDLLNIQLPEAAAGPLDVEVFDAQGRLQRRQSLIEGQRLEVQELEAGIYMLKAAAGERVYVGRFVKG